MATGFGDAVAVGDGEGDGSTVGLGLAATMGVAEVAFRERIASVAPINRNAATTAATIISCFLCRLEPISDTESLGNERVAVVRDVIVSGPFALLTVVTAGLTTVISVKSALAARVSRKREMSITNRPDGDSVPTLRSASMFGPLVIAACSRPNRSAVVNSS